MFLINIIISFFFDYSPKSKSTISAAAHAKNNSANYKTDVKDCAQAYPETPDGVYLKGRIACLQLKGWR